MHSTRVKRNLSDSCFNRTAARSVHSVFSDDKNLSIMALSHTLPHRLIETATP